MEIYWKRCYAILERMQKRTVFIFIIILFFLALLVGGELYWLKRLEKKVACEFNGKTYQLDEIFLIRLSSGCSICRCGENGLPICKHTYCPEEASE
mgnify:CR=1 FL=1